MERLRIFVLYNRPRDFPDHAVVREHVPIPGRGTVAVAYVGCLYPTVDAAMADLERRGLAWIPRYADDDPVIVGCWL